MKGMFLLYVLHIASVTSRKLIPLKAREFRKPDGHVIHRRLYGGTLARRDEFPFMVLVLLEIDTNKWQRCSGALVTLSQALTAAHCVYFPDVPVEKCLVAGGNSNLDNYAMARFKIQSDEKISEHGFDCEERRAKELFIHPQYGATNEEVLHDVALIKVEEPFTTPLLGTIPVNFEKILSKQICTVLGWGMITSGDNYRLNAIYNKEISTTSLGCRYAVNLIPLICLNSDTKSGTCIGDAGGPLVCNGTLVGVASHMMADTESCGNSLEEYFIEISNEKEWFDSVFDPSNSKIRSDQISFSLYGLVSLWICWDIFY